MIRLLIGITLFKALFHRRSPLRGLIVGGLIGFFAHRHFEQGQVREEAREEDREARKEDGRTREDEVRAAARREAHEEKLREIHARIEARKAEKARRLEEIHDRIDARREQRLSEIRAEAEARRARRESRKAEPAAEVKAETPYTGTEAQDNRNLVDGLEREARTAAMMHDVPVIHFPEEDEKYHASRKYGYA